MGITKLGKCKRCQSHRVLDATGRNIATKQFRCRVCGFAWSEQPTEAGAALDAGAVVCAGDGLVELFAEPPNAE